MMTAKPDLRALSKRAALGPLEITPTHRADPKWRFCGLPESGSGQIPLADIVRDPGRKPHTIQGNRRRAMRRAPTLELDARTPSKIHTS